MDHIQVARAASHSVHLSTEMLAVRHRFDEWYEGYVLKVVRAELVAADRARFRASTRARLLQQLYVASTDHPACGVRRTRELTRDGHDYFHLITASSGTFHLRLADQEATISCGEAVLTTWGAVGSIMTDKPGSNFSVTIPRLLAREIFGCATPPMLRPIAATNPALCLLRLFGSSLVEKSDAIDPAAARLADRQLCELIATLFDPTAELARAAPTGGLKAARLRAVIAGIEQQLTNPALSAAWLGAKLGLSDRYVQHLLAEQGLSFSELVRRKRVERARAMLERPAASPPRIVDVAFEVGFGDLSSFNRAFRERFGCTPSDVLHRRARH